MSKRAKSWQDFGPLPNYERCVRFEIEGRVGVIIIHNTTLGPALGGFRIKPYQNESAMIADVARLARGMSYKNAGSGFDLGGGKAAVNAAPEQLTPKFLKQYGKTVAQMGGKYITAPDFGSDVAMMDVIATKTPSVVCLSKEKGGLDDPSPSTARGVFFSLRTAVSFLNFKKSKASKVLLQGYGKVGKPLAFMLRENGCEVVVAETAAEQRNQAKQDNFELVDPEKIYQTPADIFSPNAVGGILNPKTIPLLKKGGVQLICGGANNQLEEAGRDMHLLKKNRIWYIPDFIANAGGVAIAYTEWQMRNGEIRREEAPDETEKRLQKIAKRVKKIIQIAQGRGLTTLAAAERLAEETVADQGGRLR